MPNNIFLLEAIAYRVLLTDTDQRFNTCPVCVSFRFPGLADLDVCEGTVCDARSDGGEISMTRGKSCLFAVDAADLCRAARDFCDHCTVDVYRCVDGGPETRFVASARLEFDSSFEDLMLDPNQADRSRKTTATLPLMENGRKNPVGTVEIFVRLTSQGQLLVTQFSKSKDSDKYHYKGVDEFVSTDVKGPVKCTKCSRRKRRHRGAKNGCTEISCGKGRTSVAGERDTDDFIDECAKQMKQVKCLLTVMEQMKELFARSTLPPALVSDEIENDEFSEPRECMFDRKCPVDRCPFKIGDPVTALVDRMTSGDQDFEYFSKGAAEKDRKRWIVDDADLMVVKVGRVDPCRTDELKHRDGSTQYLVTDISAESLLQLPPPPPTPAKSTKRKGKSSKGKKGKGGKNKK